MLAPIPHGHITKKLKRSLLVIVGFGFIFIVLLSVTVGLVSYNISQTTAHSKAIADQNLNRLLQSQQKFSLPENTSYIPSTLNQSTLVNVIARNQPSVVRIVMVYCADITLVSKQATANFSVVCSGKSGSGSFISSDGYIATNGHVTSITPLQALVDSLKSSDVIEEYLKYLVLSGLMTSHDADSIQTGMATNNVDAQTALNNSVDLIPATQVNAGNATTDYAIQLSNQPITLAKSNGRLSVQYSDTVIKADLIDEEYDQATADLALATGQFISHDAALLKAMGSFPYITLDSYNTTKVGDRLTAIGFPAAIDGVSTTLIQSVPSITQGKVINMRIALTGELLKIIDTNVQIGQGSSGGPALNDAGQEIGINSYADIKCPDLKCFGNGEVRDIVELKALIKKNNITLKSGGVIDDWTKALNAYTKGNYSDAITGFTKVVQEYPSNYLTEPLLEIAKLQVGSKTDTSSSYQAKDLVMVVLAVLVEAIVVIIILMICLIILFTIHFHIQTRRLARFDNKA
jgi:hypothetical protein